MPTSRRPRRTADQWRTIIQRFDASDNTPAEFCRRERLSVTSFDRWRHRFAAEKSEAGFIELHDTPSATPQSPESWTLEIDLPGGGSLRLRSGC